MSDRTALGAALTGLAILGFAAAVLLGTLAPAVAALVLLGTLESARRAAVDVPVEAERTAPPRGRMGEDLETRVVARSASGLPLAVEDLPPEGGMLVGTTRGDGRGEAVATATVRPGAPGAMVWTRTRVVVRDPWGTWQVARELAAPARTEVAPEPEWAARGRRAGRRRTVQAVARARHAQEPQPEPETVREYRPGDRVRDIDWARSSRLGLLFTKERERASPRRVLVLLDAGRSMRIDRRVPKLATAARIAAGVAAAAEGAGVSASLVAFHEGGVEHSGLGGAALREVLERLAALPAVTGGDLLLAGEDLGPDAAESAFLRRVAPFVGGAAPGLPPFEGALAVLTRGGVDPGMVVALLDAEADPQRALVAVDRLRRRGHEVVLVVPATGPHHAVRAEADGGLKDTLREAYVRRKDLERRLASRRVEVLVARPGEETQVIEEVARRAQ